MNPYALLGGLLVAIALMFGAERAGEHRGAALQSAVDQKALDKVHNDLDAMHAQATQLIADAATSAAKAAQAAAELHQHQEMDHANDQSRTDASRRALDAAAAAGRLRFTAAVPAAACGPGGGASVPAGPDTAGAARTATVDLPVSVSVSLRQLMFEADKLADDYREAYRSLYPAWHPPLAAPEPGPAP